MQTIECNCERGKELIVYGGVILAFMMMSTSSLLGGTVNYQWVDPQWNVEIRKPGTLGNVGHQMAGFGSTAGDGQIIDTEDVATCKALTEVYEKLNTWSEANASILFSRKFLLTHPASTVTLHMNIRGTLFERDTSLGQSYITEARVIAGADIADNKGNYIMGKTLKFHVDKGTKIISKQEGSARRLSNGIYEISGSLDAYSFVSSKVFFTQAQATSNFFTDKNNFDAWITVAVIPLPASALAGSVMLGVMGVVAIIRKRVSR